MPLLCQNLKEDFIMVVLNNGIMSAEIREVGAELRSLKKDGVEYMWAGRPEVWQGVAPLLFPICGGLKDDKYILNGKEYKLQKHGFARFKTFEVEEKSDTRAVFLIRDDDETFVEFPFKFELRVIYTLEGSSLNINYKVNNLSEETMYFSIGSHEGFSTPEGIEDYDLIFPERETLSIANLDGNLTGDARFPILYDSNVLPLYEKYFVIDAMSTRGLKSRSATLRNRKTGKALRLDFEGNDYFVIWHKPSAPYICLEPWAGVSDSIHSNYDITKKEGIQSLVAGGEYNNDHTITILQ